MTKKTILLIEEDRMVSSLITFRLKKEGYSVESFTNEMSALSQLKNINADLVLYGLSMVNFSGANFIQKLKNSLDDNIPVIIATSNKQQNRSLQNSGIQVNAIINKPIILEDLMALVAKNVKISSAFNDELP
ncbi:response regulator [Galbibacter sp. BG1]|uniref:response regulator n=1 Tax=Galbibacter sp. BG1 TaxID=1170699 RepID=UPI0015BDA7FC|nr:response regulator [Galbibacter sp. BG1]QLE02637.1 response regulator [Galbibacter sp. BG1]